MQRLSDAPGEGHPKGRSLKRQVTVGVDIGTTSVKAVAVDGEGNVLARTRVPHKIITPEPGQLEHDVAKAWQQGPSRALSQVSIVRNRIDGIGVASMVPSITAVGRRSRPMLPGVLYGDGRASGGGGETGMPDARGFLAWAKKEAPDALGYWPCQATAVHALCGVPALDTAAAIVFGDLHDHLGWNAERLGQMGVKTEQMPTVVQMGEACGETESGAVVAGGTIDALCDQLVCDAAEPGDVLAIFGATLVVWIVIEDWLEFEGLVAVPHTVPGRMLVGGPSNAGALFVDWARGVLRGTSSPSYRPSGVGSRPPLRNGPKQFFRDGDPFRVPVWLPYVRGERTPFNDPKLRASLHGLDITQTPAALERGVYEASGFVINRMLEISGMKGRARRIVASGGGSQHPGWMAGVADATGLPVDPVAVPEGGAYGAAFVARVAAGLEPNFDDSRRWAKCGTRIDPDATWEKAAQERYKLFGSLGSGTGGSNQSLSV